LKELTDYLDDTMDSRTKAELEEHLQWCHNCYVVCNTTKSTIEIYRDSKLYELPDELRSRIHAAIVANCQCHKSSAQTTSSAKPRSPETPQEKPSK
jgi:predicted anti-sigma-YlaC factor YlaD